MMTIHTLSRSLLLCLALTLSVYSQAKSLESQDQADKVSDFFMSQILSGDVSSAYALIAAYLGVDAASFEEQGKKGTDAHKAAVVGDTVGDPFKDTSGPSLNILLKLMSVVALVIAPSIAITTDGIAAYTEEKNATELVAQNISKEIKVEMNEVDNGVFKAVVTTVVNENGEKSTNYETFEGTEAEVKQAVSNLKKENNS